MLKCNLGKILLIVAGLVLIQPRCAECRVVGPRGGVIWELAVSPDGRQIAVLYTKIANNEAPRNLLLIDVRTGKTKTILSLWSIGQLSWSPDGRYLLFEGVSPQGRLGVWAIRTSGALVPQRMPWNEGPSDNPPVGTSWWTLDPNVYAFIDPNFPETHWVLWNVVTNQVVVTEHPRWPQHWAVCGVARRLGYVSVCNITQTHPPGGYTCEIWQGRQWGMTFDRWTKVLALAEKFEFSDLTVAPDGRFMAKTEGNQNEASVVILDQRGRFFSKSFKVKKPYGIYHLEWSQDGRFLAYGVARLAHPNGPSGVESTAGTGYIMVIRPNGQVVKRIPNAVEAHWLGNTRKLLIWRDGLHAPLEVVNGL